MVAYGSIWFYELNLTWKEAFLVTVLNFYCANLESVALLDKGNLGPNFIHLERNQEV